MKLITQELGTYATLTGFVHERNAQLWNVKECPAVLICPGGGFRVCSKAEGEPIAMRFFAEGYQAFVLDYTTVSKNPDAVMEDPMNDARAALTWMRENAQELDLNPGHIAMVGFSGGSHLAAAVATHGDVRPNALVLGYPGIVHNDLRALDCPDIPECVDAQTPPSFIFSTFEDPITPPVHPLTFAQALTKAGVPYELHIFEKGGHGMSLGNSITSQGLKEGVNDAFAQWVPMCLRWLKDRFGDFLVYGVNDGRQGRLSIDTAIPELKSNAKAWAAVLEYVPAAEGASASPMAKTLSVRALSQFVMKDTDPEETKKKLAELDEILLDIR